MPLMTKTEYAAHYGCNKAYLSKKDVKERLAAAMIRDDQGDLKIDSDKADEIFKLTQDPARAPFRKSKSRPRAEHPEETGLLSGYETSRAKREYIKAEHAELDLLERKGQTLNRSDVVKAIMAAGAMIREHLAARNRRISEKAATMKNAREINSMLDADDRAMLEMISHDLNQRVSLNSDDIAGARPSIN